MATPSRPQFNAYSPARALAEKRNRASAHSNGAWGVYVVYEVRRTNLRENKGSHGVFEPWTP